MPIITDDDSVEASVQALERKARGMSAYLQQFQPTVSLGSDARLMYVLAEDPNAQTTANYPDGYSKPLLDDGADIPHRLARTRSVAQRLINRIQPFMVQHLPGLDQTSLQGHAIPLGFVAVHGCDVNWNGRAWETTAGKLNIATLLPGQRDVIIPRMELGSGTGLVFLTINVQYNNDDAGVTILGAGLAFGERGAARASTTISYNPVAGLWSPGTVISPLAWVLAPTAERPAPVVLRMGNGEFPVEHTFMRPIGMGGLQPVDAP